MGLPVIVDDAIAAFQCPHGGKFKISTSSNSPTVTDTAGEVCFNTNPILGGIPVCPATIPTHGVPPCIYLMAVGSGSKKLHLVKLTVTFADIQIAVSNGLPHLIYLIVAQKVTTL